MTKLPTVEELYNSGAHFGHLKAKSHPQVRNNIFSVVNGVFIIDLDKTRAMLERALDYIKSNANANQIVLFVGTKRQAKEAIEKACKTINAPFITNKWLGGTLTNFTTIKKNLKKLENLESQITDPIFSSQPKKIQASLRAEADRLHRTFDGIKNLDRLPNLLVVVDAVEEKTAIAEAKALGIPVVALLDTNGDLSSVEYPILVNDDSFKTVDMVIQAIANTIAEAKKTAPKKSIEE